MALFRSKYKITQVFGGNKDYYGKFGLAGHEGLDVIPTGTDWTVKALADGVVVKDDDIAGDPRYDVYGKFVTIWHPELKRATQYCHLANNTVSLNQKVKKGDSIGTMGNTGNSSGAHVHLNLFETDGNGVRLNTGNGFLGGINPEPFLAAATGETTNMYYKGYDLTNQDSMKVAVDVMVRVQNGEFVDKPVHENRVRELEKEREDARNDANSKQQVIDNLNQQINDRNNDIVQLNARISTLETQVTELTQKSNSLEEQAKRVPELESLANEYESHRVRCIEQEKTYNRTIGQLKAENEALRKNAFRAWLVSILDKLGVK